MSDHREDVVVRVFFVAIFGESARSPVESGFPPIHADTPLDAANSPARPSARRRGSGGSTPRSSQAVDCERGRTDRAPLDSALGRRPDEGANPPERIGIRDGRIRVALPPGMTRAGFPERRHAAAHLLRAKVAQGGMAHLPRRFDVEAEPCTFPGRAGQDSAAEFRGGAVVADPFTVEPGEPPRASFRMVAPARSAVVAGSHP